MKYCLTLLASLIAFCGAMNAQENGSSETKRQPQPAAYFAMTNLGGAFDFNEADWRHAVANAGERIYWKIDTDTAFAQRVLEVAASVDGAPPFAWLYSVSLRPDQANKFDQLLDSIVAEDAKSEFSGAEFVMQAPLCRLLRLPKPADGSPREYYVATVDNSDSRRTCYAQTIAHVLSAPDAFQPPELERIVIDGSAAAAQAVLPPISVKTAEFIDPETWKTERQAVPRKGENVFASGEMIMLHAILENVGRDMAGTSLATYEIQLDLEIRDAAGVVVADQKDVMRFNGSALHSVPIKDNYFETGVVAGFPLDVPGTYEIIFKMTDLNRPQGSAVVEVPVDVIVQ